MPRPSSTLAGVAAVGPLMIGYNGR